jgi:lipopolysaccharide export system protein LptA
VRLAAALALSAAAGPVDAQAANEKAPPAPTGSQAPASQSGGPFAFGSLGKSKEPITVISDKLDYDYKANIVVYRGAVEVTQGDVKMVADVLTITLENDKQNDKKPTTGRATYEQQQRTLVLTENPVLHDGPNEVVGERVTVYLDENRSVVEGGQKRVKAVFHPNEKNNAAPAKPKAATPAAAKRTQ